MSVLQIFGFKSLAVAIGDLYFVDPAADAGQEGAEHGVRLELRMIDAAPPSGGSIYASQLVSLGVPIWRADLLETVAGKPGSFDRTHHHPQMQGWEPGPRCFDPDMTADPIRWLGRTLSDLDRIVGWSGLATLTAEDKDGILQALREITAAVERGLEDVRSNRVEAAAEAHAETGVRRGWL